VVKSVLVVLVLAGFACAEDKPVGTALPPVCGAAGVKFDVKTDSERQTAAAHFTAAAGAVYYFRVKNKGGRYSAAGTSLRPLDSDEFLLLASTFSFSTSHEKK
jgi:hypothetical protein